MLKHVIDAVIPATLLSSFVKPFSSKSSAEEDGYPFNVPSSMKGDSPEPPPPIDNVFILRKRSAGSSSITGGGARVIPCTSPVLAANLELGTHLELVPPEVYRTFFLWYGGGPQVTWQL